MQVIFRPRRARGLGDSIEIICDKTGVSKVVKTISKVTGKPCGCKKRRDALNKIAPYRSTEPEPPSSD